MSKSYHAIIWFSIMYGIKKYRTIFYTIIHYINSNSMYKDITNTLIPENVIFLGNCFPRCLFTMGRTFTVHSLPQQQKVSLVVSRLMLCVGADVDEDRGCRPRRGRWDRRPPRDRGCLICGDVARPGTTMPDPPYIIQLRTYSLLFPYTLAWIARTDWFTCDGKYINFEIIT